jgi:hypothetical protein
LLKIGADATVNVGVPGATLALYLIAVALLAAVGKRLQAFMGISGPVVQDASSSGASGDTKS